MPKRVAVIDIGSNSARLVIYQRSSRYGFHLICQQKSRVRIGEGAYSRGGELQSEGVKRAYGALSSFAQTIKEYKVRKTLCVATSALRDAPNRSKFISLIRRELGLNIKVIDGKKEAYFSALSAKNLLPLPKRAITIDIGGGSTDIALIDDGKIVDTISLNLGTVRLKELFTDKSIPLSQAKDFVNSIISTIPEEFKSSTAVGIGGTVRAFAKSVITKNSYPLDKLHAFEFNYKDEKKYINKIINANISKLLSINIKKNRVDTIREGLFIFKAVLEHIGADRVITSGVGVREGVFLNDLLRNDSLRFPPGINPSVRSILDRFDLLSLPIGNRNKTAKSLYRLLILKGKIEEGYERELQDALKLSNIGKMLTIYKEHQHAFYIAMQELNYGYTHSQMVLIALLLRSKGDNLYYKPLYKEYKELLPSKKIVKWLCFIYTLTLIINENSSDAKIEFELREDTLYVKSSKNLYLAREEISSMERPNNLKVEIIDSRDEERDLGF